MKDKIIEILDLYAMGFSETREAAAKEITALINENYVPRDFVEWINWEDEKDDFHFIRDYTTNTWMNADEKMRPYDLNGLLQYWKTNIRDK